MTTMLSHRLDTSDRSHTPSTRHVLGLADDLPHLSDHLAVHGPLRIEDTARLWAAVDEADVRGRGGAGFPPARKAHTVMRSVERAGTRPVVIANGVEGEPLSGKDRYLMTHAPHLVIDGVVAAAALVGADQAHMVVHPHAIASISKALAERPDLAHLPVTLHEADRAFVAGQETAVIAAADGRPRLPSDAPVVPAVRGWRGRPTLVSNVETLAVLAILARRGAGALTATGTARQPGSGLVTVARPDLGSTVQEVAYGTPMSEVLGRGCAQWTYVLVGGYHGIWARAVDVLPLTFDDDSLATVGAHTGPVLAGIGPESDLAERVESILAYLATQSARRCGPCVNGLPALATTWAQWRRGDASASRRLAQLAELLPGRGACAMPDGTVHMAMSAYRLLTEEEAR